MGRTRCRGGADYPDIFLEAGNRLFERFQKDQIDVDQDILNSLYHWFDTRIIQDEIRENETIDIKGGVGATLPVLQSFFLKASKAIETNTTSKEIIQQNVKNTFSAFVRIFNTLVEQREVKIKNKFPGKTRILFIIDGLDRGRPLFIENSDALCRLKQA